METVEMTFEQKLEQIKEIIDGIEGGQQSLEESVRQYETGIQILNGLEKDLSDMKRRISVLQEQRDGSLTEIPMEADQ